MQESWGFRARKQAPKRPFYQQRSTGKRPGGPLVHYYFHSVFCRPDMGKNAILPFIPGACGAQQPLRPGLHPVAERLQPDQPGPTAAAARI